MGRIFPPATVHEGLDQLCVNHIGTLSSEALATKRSSKQQMMSVFGTTPIVY